MLECAYISVKNIDVENDRIFDYLSPERANKVKRLQSPDAKRESAGAELLLNSLFGMLFPKEQLPVRISTSDNGKPFFPDYENLYFNLSHSNGIAACVISDLPVGIDIQYMGKYDTKISERFFTADEQKYIFQSDDKDLAFYTIWAKKEALLKCTGRGMGAVSSTSVLKAENGGFYFKTTHFDNYMLCICQMKPQ